MLDEITLSATLDFPVPGTVEFDASLLTVRQRSLIEAAEAEGLRSAVMVRDGGRLRFWALCSDDEADVAPGDEVALERGPDGRLRQTVWPGRGAEAPPAGGWRDAGPLDLALVRPSDLPLLEAASRSGLEAVAVLAWCGGAMGVVTLAAGAPGDGGLAERAAGSAPEGWCVAASSPGAGAWRAMRWG